jgi:3-hydroxybutyryl-CoA dehydrogenase
VAASDFSAACVLGTGTMGRGIAQVLATAGLRTHLYDASREQLENALRDVQAGLERLAGKGKLAATTPAEVVGRMVLFEDAARASESVDVVIEAVPESLDTKVALFLDVVRAAPEGALLATNTSSLSVSEIARRAGAPRRLVGMHFFNPPPVMELVEVVQGRETDDENVARAVMLARRLGKTPIVVRDSPGFATSRLGLALGVEAMRMVEAKVASIADIDRAMELGYRHPMGPLKLTDLVGLDVRLAILEHLHREIGEQFRPPQLLRSLVRAGHFGKKAGRGFYVWTDAGPVPDELP